MDTNFVSQRSGHDQLPQGQELLAIMAKEAKRPVASGKENVHFGNYSLIVEWLEMLDLPTDFFIKEPIDKLGEAIVMPEDIQETLARKTLIKVEMEPNKTIPLLEKVTNYLGEKDMPQSSDIIFVFGSPGVNRIKKAVELYKHGLAPKIFISGGRPFYKPEADSEAIRYQKYALENGISKNVIAIHDDAVSIADNVRGGLNKLDDLKINYGSLILVTSWFVQRRCWAHMMKYVHNGTNLYRVNAESNPNGGLTENDWYKSEKGLKTVVGEFFKLRVSEVLNTS